MEPSQPGYNFTTADLAAFNIAPRDAAQLLVAATGGVTGNLGIAPGDTVAALLAELVRSQRRFNALFAPSPFSLAAWTRQQILAENPLRSYLLIQNVGSGDVMVLFETASVQPEDLSGATNELTVSQVRAVRIVAGGNYEPLVAPSNPITLFTLGTASSGLVIEGR